MSALPELLRTVAGEPVTAPGQWESVRRGELLSLFSTHVFGRTPVFDGCRFTVESQAPCLDGGAVLKRFLVHYWKGSRGGSFPFLLLLPRGVPAPPVLLLGAGRVEEHSGGDPAKISRYWPAEAIVARGIATAFFHFGDVDTDRDDGFTSGVHKVLNQRRGPDSWGAVGAWAWGYSRIMDYLETCPEVDGGRVGIVGHSRGGKAALWAGAQDKRFAMVCSNNSGCTGAAISRYCTGEQIHDINGVFPYWFCENYRHYSRRVEDLPLDQHMLLALAAPRKLYVASATEDTWADPKAEFAGCVEAAPAFALYGAEPMADAKMPPPDTPVRGNRIAYHLRTGRHFLTEYDWQRYMDFLEQP